MSELVSVIVPIYNVEEYLEKCVDSILAQSYKNIEVILVDDGSPDKCGDICDKYKEKDARIKVLHKQNGGLSDARNAGIEMADGNYIMFIDSDDYIQNNMIETLYSRIKKDNSDIAQCNFLIVYDEDNSEQSNGNMPFDDEVITSDEALERLFSEDYWYLVTACNKLYKRHLFSEIRFPYSKYHEDEFVAHLIIEKCNLISLVKEPLYYYYQRNTSIMGSTFNIRNLDGAEAFLNRSDMLTKKGKPGLAASIMRMSLSVLVRGCDLDQNEFVKKRRKELKQMYNNTFYKVIFKNTGMGNKIRLTLGFISIDLYHFLTHQFSKKNTD